MATQDDLTKLRAARTALLGGTSVAKVTAFGRSTEYRQVNLADLSLEIERLERELGVSCTKQRATKFEF